MVLFMDEVVSKWGFGSGISLFIVAGVSKGIFLQAFNWLPGPSGLAGVTYSAGAIPAFFQSLAAGDPTTAAIMISAVIATILVFVMAVYAQAMKVEIPLSFGMVRGHGIRYAHNRIGNRRCCVQLGARGAVRALSMSTVGGLSGAGSLTWNALIWGSINFVSMASKVGT